jgi:acyl-CoA reductase-like NAD-dependent aldehyde dehydrogenase
MLDGAMTRYGPFIDGEPREARAVRSIRDPQTGREVHEVGDGGEAEVEAAVASACRAFRATAHLSRAARSEILARAAAAIDKRAAELAETVRLEAGKPIALARWEVARCLNTFTLAAEEAKRLTGELVPADILPRYEGYRALYERFPIGPVLGITPFNFPLNLVAHKIAPGLAAGNSVVIKPAPQTPACAFKLAEIVQSAGAPRGAVNVVSCSNELAGRMVGDERFKMLSFTGGARTGWQLKTAAGKKKVTLELGGNAGLVVAADVDLRAAAKKAAIGGFAYAGQACISVQRILVEQSAHDSFLAALVEETRALVVGDTADPATVVGPMINAETADRVMAWVEEARKNGARVLAGGNRNGNVIDPVVLVDVKPTMKVSCEEVFGPVVTVESYADFADAIERVNDSPFGLQAGVFTHDYRKIDAAFRGLEVGAVLVNETSYFRIDNYPYGGVKDSGFGREGVRYAMESMTEPRVLVIAPA